MPTSQMTIPAHENALVWSVLGEFGPHSVTLDIPGTPNEARGPARWCAGGSGPVDGSRSIDLELQGPQDEQNSGKNHVDVFDSLTFSRAETRFPRRKGGGMRHRWTRSCKGLRSRLRGSLFFGGGRGSRRDVWRSSYA
eukprot:742980-Amorphochlora_amoeboformis.AAC.1